MILWETTITENVYITLYEDGTYALTWNDINGIRTGDYIYEGGILYVDYYEFTVDRSNDTLFLSHESEYEYRVVLFKLCMRNYRKTNRGAKNLHDLAVRVLKNYTI